MKLNKMFKESYFKASLAKILCVFATIILVQPTFAEQKYDQIIGEKTKNKNLYSYIVVYDEQALKDEKHKHGVSLKKVSKDLSYELAAKSKELASPSPLPCSRNPTSAMSKSTATSTSTSTACAEEATEECVD